MASVTKRANGLREVSFFYQSPLRKYIRLGRVSAKAADAFSAKLEALLGAKLGGNTPEDQVLKWVAGLDDRMHAKLAGFGLVDPRKPRTTGTGLMLKEWLDRYTTSQTVKPNTQLVYGRTVKHLVEFFGPGKPLAEITKLDAQDWRKYLVKYGLAPNTVARTCGIARQFFKAAVDNDLIAKNPFAVLKGQVHGNKAREYFLSRQDAEKILEACPDAQWRLIFGLARFGGLRCPSEILALTWQDILGDKGKMLVHSPKTEHHEGGETRYVPIFPELAPLLQEAFDQSEPGTVYVITRYRKRGCNLRTQFNRILAKAGVKPWPKLMQNLRSSRQTELSKTYPLHLVCAWLGNSRLVAQEHYLQVRDSDFLEASGKAQQNAQQSAAERHCDTLKQTEARQDGNPLEGFWNADLQCAALAGSIPQDGLMGGTGLEPVTSSVSSWRSSQLS